MPTDIWGGPASRERGEWETYLSGEAARLRELSDRISAVEREIDAIVYPRAARA